MPNPRTPIEHLEFVGSHNLNRARGYLERDANQPPLLKQAEMEALFEELQERRREALADVRKNGAVISQEKSNSRGMIYLTKVVNPSLKVAQDAERQLAKLAKLLGVAKPRARGQGVEEFMKEVDAMLGTEN